MDFDMVVNQSFYTKGLSILVPRLENDDVVFSNKIHLDPGPKSLGALMRK